MADWKPEEFEVGDRVIDPSHANWGMGVVVTALRLSDLPLSDGTAIIIRPKTLGQRLGIRFEDGRTRTIISSSTPLRRVP